MTEAEWLTATDPRVQLEFLWDTIGRRRLRLFAVACCNRIEPLILRVPRAGRAVVLAEREADQISFDDDAANLRVDLSMYSFGYIDGYRYEKENQTLYYAGTAAAYSLQDIGTVTDPHKSWYDVGASLLDVPAHAARAAAHNMRRNDRELMSEQWYQRESAQQILQAYCIFGNPFRPVTADPGWLTPTVVALAEAVYADRAFDRLPILADALEESGCDNADVLAHCRGDGPHARGCWVVDLVLGKA